MTRRMELDEPSFRNRPRNSISNGTFFLFVPFLSFFLWLVFTVSSHSSFERMRILKRTFCTRFPSLHLKGQIPLLISQRV